jgi:hypothetical protein
MRIAAVTRALLLADNPLPPAEPQRVERILRASQ